MEGIKSILQDQNDIEIFIEYMDTKRKSDPEYLDQLYEIYKHKYRALRIDAVISTDDHALDFLKKYYYHLLPETPVVFCGINDFHPDRISGFDNFTGIYEAYDVAGTIRLMTRLHPKTKTIAVIVDSTLSGEAFKQRVERIEGDFSESLTIRYLYNLKKEELSSRLRELPRNSLILWAIYLKPRDEEYISSRESIDLVKASSSLPIYCIWDVVGKGVIGGKITNPIQQGTTAGKMALDILGGRDVGSIPIKASTLEYLFDYREMSRFDINLDDLPENSIVIYRPFSPFQEYKPVVVSALILLIILSTAIVALIRDIQLRKKAENALLHSQKNLIQKRKMDAIGQLAGGIAHDFNNLLTGIIGSAELLKSRNNELAPSSEEFIDIILQASNQAADLTTKLLAFGRKGKTTSEVMDLNSVIDDSQAILSQTINRNIEIKVHKSENELIIEGDRSSIQNIIMNLIINASQAMPDGGKVDIITSSHDITPKFCRQNHLAIEPGLYNQIRVIDNGPGISKDLQKQIFEPFFTTKEEGSGLGLAAVYGTVEEHHGSIEVYSEEGIGTEFRILLPVPGGSVSSTTSPNPKFHGSGNILLIDDDRMVLNTMKHQLEDAGYKVLTAESGDRGIDIYSAKKDEIDIVILDIIMPDKNGRETFYELKEIDPFCKIFIVSGYIDEIKIEELQEAGLSAFIQKPFRLNNLLEHLLKHITK